MKRDMDLVRKILLEMEKGDFESHSKIEIEGYSDKDINCHLEIMNDEELILADDVSSIGYDYVQMSPIRITWKGHDFLEAARNDNIWEKAKSLIKDNGVGITISILTEVLKKISLEKLGLKQ